MRDQSQTNFFWRFIKKLGNELAMKRTGKWVNDPDWYFTRIVEIARLDRWSDVAEQVEQVLKEGRPLSLADFNPYKNEVYQVKDWQKPYTYPEGWVPSSIQEQLSVLQECYPELDASHVVPLSERMRVPEGADGLFVVPKLTPVAKGLGKHPPVFGRHYGRILEQTVIKFLERFQNLHKFDLRWHVNELHYGVSMREPAADAISYLEGRTPGDYLVFPAQLGLRYAGYSARNACWQMRGTKEFPLPIWCVGHMLLTNPTRITNNRDLSITVPGDQVIGEGYLGHLDDCFSFFADYSFELKCWRPYLLSVGTKDSRDHCGIASGFLPWTS